MSKYNQEIREFIEDVKRFILDIDPDVPEEDLAAEFDQSDSGTYSNKVIVAAFRNALYRIDEKIEQDVANELRTINAMIPSVADPDDINTKKIVQTIEQLIEESSESVDYVMVADEGDLKEMEDEPLQ